MLKLATGTFLFIDAGNIALCGRWVGAALRVDRLLLPKPSDDAARSDAIAD